MSNLTRKQTNLLLHIIYWVVYLVIHIVIVSYFVGYPIAIVRALISLSFHLPLVYVHLLILVPLYLERKRWFAYGVGVLGLMGILAFGRIWLEAYLFQLYIEGKPIVVMPELDPVVEELIKTILFTDGTDSFNIRYGVWVGNLVMLLMTLPLRLWQIWYDRIQLQQKRMEAELRFLRTQINPHFLFNVLNNIYTLAYTKSEQTAPMIMKLSELMRYMLYDSNVQKVSLENEIRYIQNYLELQQLRTESPRPHIFEVMGNMKGIYIAPMLLIPLFENAVKHGDITHDKGPWLRAHLTLSGNRLLLELENVYRDHSKKDVTGGIGLENMRQRLALLYPEQHTFIIDQSENIFSVTLRLHL